MKKVILLQFMLLLSIHLHAYVIKGTVTDEQGSPIRKAVVIGRNSMRKVIIGLETDPSGKFSSAHINESTLAIEISKENYATVYINISGTSGEFIDLGNITLKAKEINLNEVVVTAQSVIQKPDRYIIIPTRKELELATNGLALLNGLQYKMPGLQVNESLQTVMVENATPVFKINGKPSDINHFLALDPQRILRIEYHDNPDVRYENRRIINVVLTPRGDGGLVIADVLTSTNTKFLNGNIGIGYYQNKSEWDLTYNTNWRNYDKREINSASDFIGRKAPITRERHGIPGDFRYWSNIISMSYSYLPNPNTVFAAKIGVGLENQKVDENSWNMQRYMDRQFQYDNLTHKDLQFSSPNIDLFFRKQINKSQYIEANIYGRYSASDYTRQYINIYQNPLSNDSVQSLTNDKSWRIGADVMYSKTFKSLVVNMGIQDFYNQTDNIQTENTVLSKGNINQNRLSLYGKLQGKIKRLSYGFSAIGIYNHANNDSYKTDAISLKSNFTVNYPLSKRLTLNYLLMFEPSLPSVSQQSALVQRVDDITLRQGNPNLKPSTYIRNRAYIQYTNKRFSGSLWASYSRTDRPIYYAYSYISNASSPYYDMFISSPVNGCHNQQLNIELNLATQDLFGFVTVWGNVGWSNFHITTTNQSYVKNRLYASLNGALSFDNWLITARYQIKPDYHLLGNSYRTDDRWNTIKVQYKYKNWNFSLTGVNMLTKRGSTYENIIISDIHPEKYSQYIRDNANQILLGVNYHLNFGKKQHKTKRSLHNDGIDRNIDISY
ncbi:TonB-dependent receptor [Prevotella sp.]|uniref:TonB-dependent receptor n=1 Tax=Prevotella sp. TaxID=59823 RepID=UPI002F93D2E7